MTTNNDASSNGQDQVSAAYHATAIASSPGSHLDAQILELAKNELELSRRRASSRQRLFGVPASVLIAAAALLVLATAGINLLLDSSPSPWQPTQGTQSSKPPATLPPVPAIEAPILVPPSQQPEASAPAHCERPIDDQQCPPAPRLETTPEH